jgi:hypothetical protein
MPSRRLIFAASLAAAMAQPPAARAAEAATPAPADGLPSAFTEAERTRISERLRREDFLPVGEPRRKGTLVILVAVRQDVPWRLVLDGRSGDIIGRRPMAEAISLAR